MFFKYQKNNKNSSFIRCLTLSVKSKKSRSGFTLIELVVVTGIFVIVTGIILANYSRFSSSIVLENVAYDIALSIRQSQTYGMIVREFGTGTGIFPAYGTYFYSGGNGASEFYIFADTEGADNKIYDNGPGCILGVTNECFDKLTLQNTYKIYTVCGNLKEDNISLPNDPARTVDDLANEIGVGKNCGDYDSVNITFTRPNPDALIKAHRVGKDADDFEILNDVEIIVASPRGDIRSVVVWNTGQISIE